MKSGLYWYGTIVSNRFINQLKHLITSVLCITIIGDDKRFKKIMCQQNVDLNRASVITIYIQNLI